MTASLLLVYFLLMNCFDLRDVSCGCYMGALILLCYSVVYSWASRQVVISKFKNVALKSPIFPQRFMSTRQFQILHVEISSNVKSFIADSQVFNYLANYSCRIVTRGPSSG